MSNKAKTFITILIIFIVGSFTVGFVLWNKPQRNVENEKGIEVPATQLVKDYQANEAEANKKYLDKAIMLGFPSIKLIHGKGDGILRKMIREYLHKYSQVNRMEDEHADRGGDGITYVYLN